MYIYIIIIITIIIMIIVIIIYTPITLDYLNPPRMQKRGHNKPTMASPAARIYSLLPSEASSWRIILWVPPF
jgi:hypothetical protein